MGCLTINTQANRVVIISTVITRIFFNSVQCLDSHISTCFNKDTLIYLFCAQCSCASYIVQYFITVVRLILFLVRLFRSSFGRLLFSFNYFAFSLFIVPCPKKKDLILILDCIPGILIPLYMKYLFIIIYASQINIIHQTAPTLSQYRSEWPIMIIDIAGYTEPIFSKSYSKQRARQLAL